MLHGKAIVRGHVAGFDFQPLVCDESGNEAHAAREVIELRDGQDSLRTSAAGAARFGRRDFGELSNDIGAPAPCVAHHRVTLRIAPRPELPCF